MPLTDAQKRAKEKYRVTHYKQVNLQLQLEDYARLKAAADAAGESVNGFIKAAIAARIASAAAPDPVDGQPASAQAGPADAIPGGTFDG